MHSMVRRHTYRMTRNGGNATFAARVGTTAPCPATCLYRNKPTAYSGIPIYRASMTAASRATTTDFRHRHHPYRAYLPIHHAYLPLP